MNERIEAWLRLRDTARFNAEAESAAHSIRDIGDAADETDRDLDLAGKGMDEFGESLVDVGDQGHSVGNQLKFLGSRGGAMAQIIVASLPFIIAFAGALTAVAASAAAATAGLAALALGGIGTLVVGLGGVGIILGQTISDLKKVKTAYDAFNLAVEQHGKNSQEAKDAQEKLNAVVRQNGGPVMLQLIKRVGELGKAWRELTRPAVDSLKTIFGSATGMIKRLLPVFATITNQSAKALEPAMKRLFGLLGSEDMMRALFALGDAFSEAIGPLARGFGKFLVGLANSAAAAAPFFVMLSRGVARLADRFAEWSTGGGPGELFATLVSHTKTWWGLIKAVGGLLIALFSGSAQQGQGLVQSLTDVINKWTAFLKTPAGRAEFKAFLTDAIELTKQVVIFFARLIGIIFRLSQLVLPILIDTFKVFNTVLGIVLWAINKLFPILKTLMKFVYMPVTATKAMIDALKWLIDHAGEAWGGIKSAVGAVYDFVKPKLEWIIDKIKWVLDKAGDVKGVVDRVIPGGGGGIAGTGIGPDIDAPDVPNPLDLLKGISAPLPVGPAGTLRPAWNGPTRADQIAQDPNAGPALSPPNTVPLVRTQVLLDRKVLVDAVGEGVAEDLARG